MLVMLVMAKPRRMNFRKSSKGRGGYLWRFVKCQGYKSSASIRTNFWAIGLFDKTLPLHIDCPPRRHSWSETFFLDPSSLWTLASDKFWKSVYSVKNEIEFKHSNKLFAFRWWTLSTDLCPLSAFAFKDFRTTVKKKICTAQGFPKSNHTSKT